MIYSKVQVEFCVSFINSCLCWIMWPRHESWSGENR